MAEAFGVGAGIVGVLGLTIQITQIVFQFGLDWKHAPNDVADFMRELRSLKTVLSETRTNLEDPSFKEAFRDRPSVLQSELGSNTPSEAETKLTIESCKVELERVLRELKKKNSKHPLGWERLRAAFLAKSTRDSIDKLNRYGQLFNDMASIDTLTLAVSTFKGVKEMRREQQKWHSDEENQAILHWISTLSFEERQRDILSKRHPETGKWFLDQEVFKDWRNGVRDEPSVLWCTGIAGAGKSVMTSIVIEHLQQLFIENDVSISYIYCDYKDRNTQTVVNLISSLVRQMLLQQMEMPREVKDLYAEHKNGQSPMSLEKYSKLLASLPKHFRRSFVVIDALDEHMISNDAEKSIQMTILDILLDLQHGRNGSNGYTLLFTSRHIGLIQETLAKCARIEISAADSDIELYLRSRIRKSSRFRFPVKVRDDAHFTDQIVSTLVEKARGMFLLPRLHLDQLECQTNVRDLRAALASLPTSVDETYNDAMTRIQNQVPESTKLALSALSWISNAVRPLKWYELQHALAIRRGDQNIDEEALVDETLLISVSAGLITLDAQSETIRLAHFTVEEYFKRNKAWFPNADGQIAEACMTYLSFEVFATGPCPSLEELKIRLQENRFLTYASQNWGHHTLRADENVNEAITLYFLTNDQMVSCCNQASLNEPKLDYGSHLIPSQSSGLHLAAQFGLLSISKRLLEHIPGADSQDSMGRTPLSLAAIEGQVEMVKFLVDQDGVSADSRDNGSRIPLLYAAKYGHTDVVKLLIARGDVIVDSRDEYGQTPLSYAAEGGYTAVVKLLAARGDVIVDSRDNFGRTPLLYAAKYGHTDVVKLLVARDDVIVDSGDNYDQTPLSKAAEHGHTEIVKLLVARDDVIADSRDYFGQTSLSYAARYGYTEVVKLLAARGDVLADSRDFKGHTPLSYAAKYGYTEIVKLLAARGDVLVDSLDKYGQTPLSHAAEEGYETVVKLLLGRGDVVADNRDDCARTPLSYAAKGGHETVVKLLLGRGGVVADNRDDFGRTPLSYAAKGGHEIVVKLLLDRGDVVADSRDDFGRTPLSYAAEWGHETVVKLLLGRGDVVVDAPDRYGHTPQYYATEYGYLAVVQLLENKLETSSAKNAADVDQ